MIHDENEYHFLRRQILSISTTSEHARANRIASQMDYNQIPSTIDPLVKAKLLHRQQKEKSIIVHYTYERRFAHYKSKIHHIWNESFHSTSVTETKLIVGTRNNPNLTKELVRRSPRPQKHETQQQLQ
jgi:hypothetical protein